MSKNEKPVKYELIEYNCDSDSSEELMSRRFDLDEGEDLIPRSYDPDSQCSAKHPTSYFETFINLFKAIVGIGIFSLPAAFAQVGYLVGTVVLIGLTYLCIYCEKILVDTQYELAKRRHKPCMNFQETAEAAFLDGPHKFCWLAPFFRITVKVLIHILTFGSACVYNVVIAENMKEVLDPWWGETNLRWYMIYLLVPMVLVNLIRNLKFITPLSAASNIVIIVTILCVLFYVFQSVSSLNHGKPVADLTCLPQFAGTVFFANSCITMVLPLRNEMKKPGNFAKLPFGVLAVGSTCVLILYWIFGMFGYLKYGDSVAESITLNLPKHHFVPKLVQCGLALATLLSTPLGNYVLFEILIEDCLGNVQGKMKIVWEYFIRVIVITTTVAVSCIIPNLHLLVSLLGVGGNSFLSMFLPAVIHLMTISNVNIFIKIVNVGIMILSVIFLITGTVSNIKSILSLYVS